jgi:hypothetical protein
VLEEKLNEAHLRSDRRKKQLILGAVAAIFLCALVLVGISFLDFTPAKQQPEAEIKAEIPPTEEKTDQLRSQFLELMRDYENMVEPRLGEFALKSWQPNTFSTLTKTKQKALRDFSTGDYHTALASLQQLQGVAEESISKAEMAVKENQDMAATFFAEDQYDEARLHIEKALLISPHSAKSLALQERIEQLPEILPILARLKVARAENDIQGEYTLLQNLSQLSPDRQGVAERLSQLATEIKNQKFETHIAKGFASLEKQQAATARQQYQQAKNLDPARQELQLLNKRLLELEKSQRVERAIADANQAIRRDDWQAARTFFTAAAKDSPDNKSVVEGLQRSDEILGIQARFKGYFSTPYQLQKSSVQREAQETIQLAEELSIYSFAIKTQARQLTELLVKINKPVAVTVISDNITYVSVRGVGKVGVSYEKLIRLLPGDYIFEGTRQGFVAKLVHAHIHYDQDSFRVEVICDEPI